MITASNLTTVFRTAFKRDVLALDDVSFECGSGEVLGLVGPNGAGKTTLMRVLSTLIRPTSGTACVAGYDILTHPDQVRENIGFVSPSHGLYDKLTIRQNLEYFGLLNGIPKHEIAEIVTEVIDWLELTEYAKANITCGNLSTGLRQRVSIARAIVHQPPVILFDEPTNGLDAELTDIVLDFIRDCRKEGQAVIFSTHLIEQAERTCTRIAVMVRGRIVEVGTPGELCERMGKGSLVEAYREILDEEYDAIRNGRPVGITV